MSFAQKIKRFLTEDERDFMTGMISRLLRESSLSRTHDRAALKKLSLALSAFLDDLCVFLRTSDSVEHAFLDLPHDEKPAPLVIELKLKEASQQKAQETLTEVREMAARRLGRSDLVEAVIHVEQR